MNCCKCSKPSKHSISLGEEYKKLPNEELSKADNLSPRNKKRIRVIGLCDDHYGVLVKFLNVKEEINSLERV